MKCQMSYPVDHNSMELVYSKYISVHLILLIYCICLLPFVPGTHNKWDQPLADQLGFSRVAGSGISSPYPWICLVTLGVWSK